MRSWKQLLLMLLMLPFLFGFTIRATPPVEYVDGSPILQSDLDGMVIRFYQRATGSTNWGTPIGATTPGGTDFVTTFQGILPEQTIELTADALMADGLASGFMIPALVWTRPTDTSPPPDNTAIVNAVVSWDWPTTLTDGTEIVIAEYDRIRAYVRMGDAATPLDNTNYGFVGQVDYPAKQFDMDTDWAGSLPKPGPGQTKYFSVSVSLLVGTVEVDGPFSPGVEFTVDFSPANHPTNIQILRP